MFPFCLTLWGMESVGEMVRKSESEYLRGSTHISKYVDFSMHDVIERIEAYLNSKHISGETDSLGREKPFFNIVVAAANVWMRATDIDRKDIQIRATKSRDWLMSFLATIYVRDWMRREGFGEFLNEWGRVLSRYGSAVVKFVENSTGLHISVTPWNLLIVDPVDFESNLKIEVLELTPAQLKRRIKSHGYYAEQVRLLIDAATTERQTLDKQRKDNRPGYIRVYEVHGEMSVANLKSGKGETPLEGDEDDFVQQIQVISYIGKKDGRKKISEYDDFVLYAGSEKEDPFMITHLIKEDGRSLAKGPVEYLFESQWMNNHSQKNVKDALDLASRLFFQTADAHFVNTNVLDEMETGDILVHTPNMPLTKVDTSKMDIVSDQNFAVQWKQLGNEIVGISEAMLGVAPKSGTAWHQTEATLTESYSLFELMTENKGLQLERMFRERILPFIRRTELDHSEEITATLEAHEIDKVDSMFIPAEAIRRYNERATKHVLAGIIPAPFNPAVEQQQVQQEMAPMGNQRFFSPSAIDETTWKEMFQDLEWDVDVDVTGEEYDTQNALTTLNTALKLVVTPGFEQNPKAQAIVGRILELTGAMSPVEYSSLPDAVTQGAQGADSLDLAQFYGQRPNLRQSPVRQIKSKTTKNA